MAASGVQYYTASTFEISPNGSPAAGYQLLFFESGTSTPFPVYSDPGLTTPIAQPIVADANGRFGAIWLSPAQAYKVGLFTAATPDNPTGSQVWSEDPIGPAAGGTISNTAGIVGEVRDFAGPAASVPSQWYLCYGQAIDRTAFAALFAVIGTTWGAGNGTTTFNLPDMRGRGSAGVDNMGGSPANRMTSGVSGISGVTLGATGGNQSVQTHDHALSDPTHNHALTDPMHHHASPTGGNFVILGSSANLAAGASAAILSTPDTADSSTGISINAAGTGITIANYGAGSSQNVQPTAMLNKIIYAGA